MPTEPVSPNGRRETVRGGRGRVLAGGQAGAGPREPPLGVDVQALQRGHVDDDAAVDGAVAGEAVAAAADRELACRSSAAKPDGARDVGRTGRPDDQRRVAVVVRRCGSGGRSS